MRNIFTRFILSIFTILFFAGCTNMIEQKASDSTEYGTLVIESRGRGLDVASIKSAIASVEGNGITTNVSKSTASVTSGKGAIEIKKIPIGKNRIVSVQAYSDTKATVAIDGAVIMAVVDIHPGVNVIPELTWTTSRKGYIYRALYRSGVNVSTLSAAEISAINTATPSCDATNIDLIQFVMDFKTGYKNLKAASKYVLSNEKVLKRVTVQEASSSTSASPRFSATAYFSDGQTQDVTSSATWSSSKTAVATIANGVVTLRSDGDTVIKGSYAYKGVTKTGANQTVRVSSSQGTIDKVYFVPDSNNWPQASAWFAAYFFTSSNNEWRKLTKSGSKYVCDRPSEYTQMIFCRMNASSSYLGWSNVWNQTGDLNIPSDRDTFYLDSGQWGDGSWGATGSWSSTLSGTYPGSLSATVEAGAAAPEPEKPSISITPSSGEIGLKGSITIKYEENNAPVTSVSVNLTGAVSKNYSLSNFSNRSLSIKLSDLGITQSGKTIHVQAYATNSKGTAAKSASFTAGVKASVPDTFTWDNVLCYFVITDRFHNGNPKNDYSYYRTNKKKTSSIPDVATFHGGDIKGITDKLDYLDKLGVNAIWITAPYEQMHGWCSGKENKFPHFSFHGYYTQDWTFMDQNMGTIEEFRTFVTEAHRRGIRVVMDVVMNHTGYNTIEDMITYKFGKTSITQHGWLGSTWNQNHSVTDYNSNDWSKWWSNWARGFDGKFGFQNPGSDDITMSLAGLPDIVTERTSTASIPAFLKTKWAAELNKNSVVSSGNTTGNKFVDYQLPSIANVDWNGKTGDWRTDNKGAPADYIVMWLSAWVREFGVDGFRCDTAKHVHMYRWGELKNACQSALVKWRADNSKMDDSGAKDWDENFWMTGECFGWTSTAGLGEYYSTGKFDSMINFSFNGSSGSTGSTPQESHWSTYLSINNNQDSDNNGNRNNVLSYVSSHDTGLHRPGDQKLLGTRLCLLPGGVQIYYGDESARPSCNGGGDYDMTTRGDMNFGQNQDSVAHWGKVGKFRKFNPAVGAGKGSAYKRTYTGPAGTSKVAIGVSGTSVNVSGLFTDGTTLYNWYDGKSAKVAGGSVKFDGGTPTQPILVSDRNPSDYGVTF